MRMDKTVADLAEIKLDVKMLARGEAAAAAAAAAGDTTTYALCR